MSIIVLVSSFILHSASATIYKCGNTSQSLSNEWDYLTFAQQWPPTFCLSQKEPCNIPADVKSWTIHGLWPSAKNGLDPEYCNSPQVFNDTSIQVLMKQLNQTWPNLIVEKPYTEFWQHEWCKHGTCAENCSEMKGEMNYFKKGIDLHEQIRLYVALESENIIPGNHYSLSNVTNAISTKFEVQPRVMCYHDSKRNQSILQQVEVCLNRDFKLIDCPGLKKFKNKRLRGPSECSTKHELVYPPFEEYNIV
ncbi:ribonuclease Oy-like [Anneissia japonica]|uniref:ribonuclease Oy-like n=1 Tax=Anneissia japonica TaxID=1529436 RepID=UPI0014256BAC|nr:ribonuclease Oy-like [Anneissia japonica]